MKATINYRRQSIGFTVLALVVECPAIWYFTTLFMMEDCPLLFQIMIAALVAMLVLSETLVLDAWRKLARMDREEQPPLSYARFQEAVHAFQSPAVPVNPLPFLQALSEGVKSNGTAWITSDEASALLFILLQQAHGQLFSLDSIQEFERLTARLSYTV